MLLEPAASDGRLVMSDRAGDHALEAVIGGTVMVRGTEIHTVTGMIFHKGGIRHTVHLQAKIIDNERLRKLESDDPSEWARIIGWVARQPSGHLDPHVTSVLAHVITDRKDVFLDPFPLMVLFADHPGWSDVIESATGYRIVDTNFIGSQMMDGMFVSRAVIVMVTAGDMLPMLVKLDKTAAATAHMEWLDRGDWSHAGETVERLYPLMTPTMRGHLKDAGDLRIRKVLFEMGIVS